MIFFEPIIDAEKVRKHNLNEKKIVKLNNQGSSMVVAIVIISILMIFSFSLLLASYTLYSSQNKNAASKRNSEAANTLSIALEKELTREDSDADSALWKYLRCNILQNETWPYYVDGNKNAYRYFDLNYNYHEAYFKDTGLEGLDGFPGKVQLCIYWMLPDGTVIQDGQSVENINPNGTRLFVEIHCETASQSYMVTNEYILTSSTFGSDGAAKTRQNRIRQLNNPNAANYEVYNPMKLDVNVDQDWKWVPVGRK